MYENADCEKTQAPIADRAYGRIQTQGAGCDRPLMTDAQILAELFRYHAPSDLTIPKYAAINQAAKNFAEVVLQNCPSSADRSAAIRLIRDARMTANAAIALNGLSL
jgi:hypothetical protein